MNINALRLQTLQYIIIVSHFFSEFRYEGTFDERIFAGTELWEPKYWNVSVCGQRSFVSRKKEYADINDIVLVKAKGRYGKQALDRWHDTERYKS